MTNQEEPFTFDEDDFVYEEDYNDYPTLKELKREEKIIKNCIKESIDNNNS